MRNLQELAVEMSNIMKVFKGVVANDSVDFQLKRASINGLLGENGAGKTTLMNILFGLYQPENGTISVNGTQVVIDSPSKAMSLGIGMVHQHFMLVRPMTVTENIMLGLPSKRWPFLDTAKVERELVELSRRYNLQVDPKARVWQLSVGEQQRVEILSALYRGTEILILDEPTAVLTPQEANHLFEVLRIMRTDGKSIILISHKLEEVLTIANEVTVLRDGRLVGQAQVTAETTKRDLTNMMVGRDVLFKFDNQDSALGKIKLVAEGLSAKNDKGLMALNKISITLHAGEVLGIAGVDGNGQKELCEVLTGLRPLLSGQVILNGRDLTGENPKEFIKTGIAHIPEDRHKTGLAMNFPLSKNFILKEFDSPNFSRRGFLNFKAIRENAELRMDEYKIKAKEHSVKAKDLSGGNQQKVILARELSSRPEIIIANQPTRGLDIGATEYVRQKLLEEKGKGVGVLLISADLEEVRQLADRIAVIYEGQIMGVLDRSASIEQIGLLMAGVKGEGVEAC
ncbi:ABC transporter ATP-binding protein [Desulfosporosinus nitroreducens]|uniref:ABC transporter ATP-binding protein n=1 Tax=Desulfosporosinus nitroreducens TaxID=2018668 RepID=UPI0035A333E6